MLATLYLKQQKLDQALAQFENLAKMQPRSVGAHTMVANILAQQHKLAEAQKRYEQVIEINPRAAVAANNLAWLYAESGNNLDVALQLAQTAKQEMPRLVQPDDTIGWIYYKKGLVVAGPRRLHQGRRGRAAGMPSTFIISASCSSKTPDRSPPVSRSSAR